MLVTLLIHLSSTQHMGKQIIKLLQKSLLLRKKFQIKYILLLISHY